MGKATINLDTHGKSSGRNGNYSTNFQISGRELLTPDEVRLLDNKYAILFIRGERPILDFKYDILKHPNVEFTTDGSEAPYIHGSTNNAVASITFDYSQDGYNYETIEEIKTDFILMDIEEIEKYLKERENIYETSN